MVVVALLLLLLLLLVMMTSGGAASAQPPPPGLPTGEEWGPPLPQGSAFHPRTAGQAGCGGDSPGRAGQERHTRGTAGVPGPGGARKMAPAGLAGGGRGARHRCCCCCCPRGCPSGVGRTPPACPGRPGLKSNAARGLWWRPGGRQRRQHRRRRRCCCPLRRTCAWRQWWQRAGPRLEGGRGTLRTGRRPGRL